MAWVLHIVSVIIPKELMAKSQNKIVISGISIVCPSSSSASIIIIVIWMQDSLAIAFPSFRLIKNAYK